MALFILPPKSRPVSLPWLATNYAINGPIAISRVKTKKAAAIAAAFGIF
jgi:hypothetical protein